MLLAVGAVAHHNHGILNGLEKAAQYIHYGSGNTKVDGMRGRTLFSSITLYGFCEFEAIFVSYSFHFLIIGPVLDALSHLTLELKQAGDEVLRLCCVCFHFLVYYGFLGAKIHIIS